MTLTVVLGANGFIGKELLATLKKKERHTIGLDLPDFDLKCEKQRKLKYLISQHEKVVIVNCTGLMGASKSQSEQKKFLDINGLYIQNVLNTITSKSNCSFIQLSTETLYGPQNKDEEPTENHDLNLHHIYALSKYCAEKLIEISCQRYKILRVPVVVGKNQAEQNPFSNFYRCAIDRTTSGIFGDGTHRRKFITVQALVELILHISDARFENITGLFNCPGKPFVINDIYNSMLLHYPYLKVEYITEKRAYSLVSNHKKFCNTFDYELNECFDDFLGEMTR